MSKVGVLSLVMLSVLEEPVSEPACRLTPDGAGGIANEEVVKAQSELLVTPAKALPARSLMVPAVMVT